MVEKLWIKRNNTEPSLFVYNRNGDFALVLVYVDDIPCATKDDALKNEVFTRLDHSYGLKDQGLLNKYLGVEVKRNDTSTKIHQTQYRNSNLTNFNFAEAHKSRIPM